jgi:hypothetical protein
MLSTPGSRRKDAYGDEIFDRFVLQEEEELDRVDVWIEEENQRGGKEAQSEDNGEEVEVEGSFRTKRSEKKYDAEHEDVLEQAGGNECEGRIVKRDVSGLIEVEVLG